MDEIMKRMAAEMASPRLEASIRYTSREEIQFLYMQTALRPLIEEQAENMTAVILNHITQLQDNLQSDEELLVCCEAGGEIIRVHEFNFPKWNVAIITGFDERGNLTQRITHIQTIQLTCKVRKLEPSGKRVRIGFILPEDKKSYGTDGDS
jgi:hypothetical protein